MAGTVPQGEQIHVDLDPAATLDAYARHRRRFATEVSELDEKALAVQSRCAEWTVGDVLRHGADVDEWMQALWSGGRPPFDSFDPVTTPHEFVVAGRAISDVEARDRYVRSSEVMAADVAGSAPERWATRSVSPLGFVPWWLSALHVFYDSWVHERDVLIPLGETPPVEVDEAVPVLAYTLAIVGTIVSDPTDIVIAGVRVAIGDPPVVTTPLTSSEVEPQTAGIIDALSGRGRIADALAGFDPDVTRRFGALARLFGVKEDTPLATSG
jgi:uncharacterized protein (TIGR03083 family)